MANPEQSRVDADTAAEIRGAVIHTISDPSLSLQAAREIAAQHPDESLDAARTAFELFPDDPAKRDAFLSGTEYKMLQERQAQEAEVLREIVEGPVTSEPSRRRWIGGRAAILAISLFVRSKKPSSGLT